MSKNLGIYKKGEYRSFEELNNAYGDDRSMLTPKEHETYVLHCYDLYESSGFVNSYDSPYESESENNGRKFTVISRVGFDEDYDTECLPVWHIEFENGEKHDAYPEDICVIEHQ